MDHDKDSVILCATNRLARNLRLTFSQRQINKGASLWPTPHATTIDAWLSSIGEQISLLGEIPADLIPDRVLTSFQESLVWKQSIESAGSDNQTLSLFDLHSLARTAAEAHALINTWHLQLSEEEGSQETQQFLNWQRQFSATCQAHGWLNVTEYQKRIFGWLTSGAGTLPSRVVFAGFDTLSPHLNQLQAVLAKRGVEISNLEFEKTPASTLCAVACDDAEAECRAAGAWAQTILAASPEARVGIVVADLEARRATIVPILDEALNPAALAGADDSPPLRYNVSLGLPLARYGMVHTALALLRLLRCPHGLALTEFGDLLRMPYWSADQTEADLRAVLDVKLRERPGQNLSISAMQRAAKTLAQGSRLMRHLDLLKDAQQKFAVPLKPSEWAKQFREILMHVGWPGERKLSSTEFQTRAAFLETLDALAELDAFLGAISIAAATSELARLCKERIFQPKTPGQPAVQVLGLLEAKGAEFDALWVMGMNDQLWPPPARPNPLLPAPLQRQHRTPGASAEVQTEFALAIHQRLLHSAPSVTFSYAQKDGERELRPSPLIEGIPLESESSCSELKLASSLFQHTELEQHDNATFEYLDDHLAPPLADGEKVSGGSGLLKAQAICPAWAFYRYRLGAKKLETPTEGLDASRRGTMVHGMLEAFWNSVRDSATLQTMTREQSQQAVAEAVEVALKRFETDIGEPLAASFRQLEATRLARLGTQWLAVEQGNPKTEEERADFRVIACEEQRSVDLGHLRINLVIDRIDELLADGRRVVLDYKTGAVDTASWSKERITEPQLPLYASIVLARPDQPPVAAVAFAKVRVGECLFKGLAAESHLLPGVGGLRPPRAEPDESEELTGLDPWQQLLDQWKSRLEAIAEEIHQGEAAVRFEDSADLRYCDVLPLLRVTERKQQFEQQEARP